MGQNTDGNSNPNFMGSAQVADIPCPTATGGANHSGRNCSDYGATATAFDGTQVHVSLFVCCSCGG
jgi:hypothetical protein